MSDKKIDDGFGVEQNLTDDTLTEGLLRKPLGYKKIDDDGEYFDNTDAVDSIINSIVTTPDHRLRQAQSWSNLL